jgi:hypothetical protein
MDGMTLELPLFLLATFACATPLQREADHRIWVDVKGYSVRKLRFQRIIASIHS